MYKIIKNNTSTMASYESKKEAYNAILSILFEITKNVPANSIEMINAKGRLDFLIDGKLFAFYQIVEFDANADENAKVKQVVINWQWPYQTQTTSSEEELAENDREDTQDGMNISNYSFDIVVTGTQVVPSTSNV